MNFRHFAPSVLEEDVINKFEMTIKSPYMFLVALVKKQLCIEMTEEKENLFEIEKWNMPRTSLSAIALIYYSAKVQTVIKKNNP